VVNKLYHLHQHWQLCICLHRVSVCSECVSDQTAIIAHKHLPEGCLYNGYCDYCDVGVTNILSYSCYCHLWRCCYSYCPRVCYMAIFTRYSTAHFSVLFYSQGKPSVNFIRNNAAICCVVLFIRCLTVTSV